LQYNTIIQYQRSKWYKKFIRNEEFKVGDWDLLFVSKFKDFKGKIITHRFGPYDVEEVFNIGSIKIKTIDEEGVLFVVNDYRLKLYNKPPIHEDFISLIF